MSNASSIITSIDAALKPLIEAEKGKLIMAADEDEAMHKLAASPTRWCVILMWNGHGSHPAANIGLTNARITTFLHMNMGLSHHVGDKLYKGDDAFIARMEKLSQWCRAMRWDAGHGVDPQGLILEDSSWVTDVAKTYRAHGLTWSLEYALEYQNAPIIIPSP